MNRKLRSSLLLFLATIIWGSAFVAQSIGMDHVGPFTFQAIRCALAAVGLLPVIWLFDRKKQDGLTFLTRFADKKLWLGGVCCAVPLFFAVNLQQIGLASTDAGKSAFLTAMYIVFVPIFSTVTGKKPSPMVLPAVLLATLGLYFLSCADAGTVGTGDIVLLLCAVAFAIQILFVAKFAPRVDPLRLNCIQALLCALGSAVVMLFTEQPTLTGIIGSWWPMCYAGFLSMGVAYSLQIMGQKDLEPSLASLIMSLESVVAAICGWLFLKESMTGSEILGCVLTFAAILLSQIPTRRK